MKKSKVWAFGVNTKKSPKEECKVVVTRSQKKEDAKADRKLQDVSKMEWENAKREEDDEKDDKVLIPKTKS